MTATPPATRRRRDPERRERILTAAAELTARRGFHAIGMADIGAEAGIVGSGVYRHLENSGPLLVALLARGMGRLQDGPATFLAAGPDDRTTLAGLIRDHVRVAIE